MNPLFSTYGKYKTNANKILIKISVPAGVNKCKLKWKKLPCTISKRTSEVPLQKSSHVTFLFFILPQTFIFLTALAVNFQADTSNNQLPRKSGKLYFLPVAVDPHQSSSSGAPCPTLRDIWTHVGSPASSLPPRSIRRQAAARRQSQWQPLLSPPSRSAAETMPTKKVRRETQFVHVPPPKFGKPEGPAETRSPARRNSQ